VSGRGETFKENAKGKNGYFKLFVGVELALMEVQDAKAQ